MSKLVFMDTNTYLSFYRLSANDVHELHKLQHAIKDGSLSLLSTDQVVDEYWRNRQNVIYDALKEFKGQPSWKLFPRLLTGYAELDAIREATRKIDVARADLVELVEADAIAKKLEADVLISALFELGTKVTVDESILDLARGRHERGNPPGKSGSYGDAINWECILSQLPGADGPVTELFIISNDGDFSTKFQPNSLSEFLERELRERGYAGTVHLYRNLGDYFKKHHPNISLDLEQELQSLVEKLRDSPNFASTHLAISDLDPRATFSRAQQRTLLETALTNTQVYAIGTDEDVHEFFTVVFERYRSGIDKEHLPHLMKSFDWSPSVK
ncbi:PIN domain-containing protein [Gephyromycinifex aptenodytis]|uniref:PIN domain-containing protein n=1 Tax=Gephyromycinifex aptenodytis TaxID=2716227 RepID=UPI001446B7FC|nr:PIN domain-containing protein [Gephyromycinifex aptenodytis]